MTRFDEILPQWQNWNNIFRFYFLGKILYLPTLTKYFCYLANFHQCKWPKIEKNILAIWSHCSLRLWISDVVAEQYSMSIHEFVGVLKCLITGIFLFIFVFSIVFSKNVHYKQIPMTGFDLQTSDSRSNRSANWATTTDPSSIFLVFQT